MRKILALVAVAGLLLAACAEDEPTIGEETGATGVTAETGVTGPTAVATAAACAQQNADAFMAAGTLTIGTDNPAYPPYFQGGTSKDSQWKINDPNTGEGFESAVGYEVASRMGLATVEWVVVPFKEAWAPGPKAFDIDLNQVSYSEKRAEAVDFSESYWDANQALVVVKGTPIADATSLEELRQYTLASQLGTTSIDLIDDYIQTEGEPAVYQTLADATAALNARQVDGLVVDYPTALYMADPYVQEVKDSIVLAQFPTEAAGGVPEYFGAVLAKGSALTGCVDLALQEMKADGTLEAITAEWLSEKTNVGAVPMFEA